MLREGFQTPNFPVYKEKDGFKNFLNGIAGF